MKKSVLVVDDNPEVRTLLGDVLSLLGYETWLAADGIAALKHLERNGTPSVVITDIMMPLMGGQELTRIVASRFGIPVIALTGDESVPVPGAAAIFRKPCDLHLLLSVVARLAEALPVVNGNSP